MVMIAAIFALTIYLSLQNVDIYIDVQQLDLHLPGG